MNFLLYSTTLETGASRSTSREAEGTGPVKPRQPTRKSVVPNPAESKSARRMSSNGREEKE